MLQAVYNRNVHHAMNITWGTYSSHIRHRGQRQGCFRCHNEGLVDSAGTAVRSDCTLCHSILSNKSARPLKYPKADTADAVYPMQDYLRQEFFGFMRK